MSASILKLRTSTTSFGSAVLHLRQRVDDGKACDEALSPGLEGVPIPERADVGPIKRRVDVVVDGFAFAPSGRARESEARIRCGAIDRTVRVFGRRTVVRRASGFTFSSPETFERIPLTNDHAYGGIDSRVGVPEGTILGMEALIDHPGLYPRSRNGKGYAVLDPEEGLELPHLEDPADLLSPDRFVVGDPRDWHRMPLPASLDWQGPLTFPRSCYFGIDPWFPAPADADLGEIQKGRMSADRPRVEGLLEVDARFFQEAQPGMTLDRLEGGEEIVLEGMHPTKPTVTLRIPKLPRVTIAVDGNAEEVLVRVQTVIVRPHEESLSIVVAASRPLPRALISGVHKRFPVTATIDGRVTVACEPPPPTTREVFERLMRT